MKYILAVGKVGGIMSRRNYSDCNNFPPPFLRTLPFSRSRPFSDPFTSIDGRNMCIYVKRHVIISAHLRTYIFPSDSTYTNKHYIQKRKNIITDTHKQNPPMNKKKKKKNHINRSFLLTFHSDKLINPGPETQPCNICK